MGTLRLAVCIWDEALFPRRMRQPQQIRQESGRIFATFLLILLVLGISGTIFLQIEKRPESSPISRGARLAEQAGCFACHGRGDEEPRFNLRPASPDGWRRKSNPSLASLDIDRVDVLVDWITHGVVAREAESHKKLFIRMPAYEGRLTPTEIEDIAAWILAERLKYTAPATPAPLATTAALTPDQLLVAGDHLARTKGCYQCHGELGQGGVANPDSLKGYIAGFQGKDFLKLTDNGARAEILHWIDHGRGQAIETGLLGGIARKYFEKQAIPMPGYRDQLTTAEKDLLADFLLLLNKSGPLPAREVERLVHLINPS
jgi:mono/diheme cytochrome c family protein